RRILEPTIEGDEHIASVEALLRPRIIREFFEKYDKNKFPREDIAKNVLAQMGIPRDRLDSCLGILVQNGKNCGVIRDTRTGLFVGLSSTSKRDIPSANNAEQEDATQTETSNVLPLPVEPKSGGAAALNNRVFISHGKNRKILDQLKTVIAYGNFDPVVSIDNETVSKPLSDKVLDDMRSCSFAVIHVEDERSLLDS